MSEQDKDWLLNTFPQHFDRTLRKETLAAYLKAEMILMGYSKIKNRDCSCQYRSLKNVVDTKYKEWQKGLNM